MQLETEHTSINVAKMSVAEFVRRLGLPSDPITVDIDLYGDVEAAGVTIYLAK